VVVDSLDSVYRTYLQRLGVDPEPPSSGALFRLHQAHVERVPYETTWIHMGERWGVDIAASVERIAQRGRGGYCFHLNGALAGLLSALGYDVSLHVGGVHGETPSADDLTNHLVVAVNGLPSDDNPAGAWYVDAGLGDALYEPLPLRAGTYGQRPMAFALSSTPDGPGDWHLQHDPRGSFSGMSFRGVAARIDEFSSRHEHLSTSPDSGFVRTVTVQRRLRDRVVALRALTVTTLADARTSIEVTNRDDWFALLADEFLLPLNDVSKAAKDRLWGSACRSHAERQTATSS
jgi:arylamine N-acetyltransferase